MGAALELARRLVTSVSEADVIAELDADAREREARRIMRAPRGVVGKQPRCAACHVFVVSISAQCKHCGWEPGIGWRG